MNSYEQSMLEILKKGSEHYGIVATKAEFEAEGTRTDELLRLLDISHRADVDIALKIGGCEAVRDLLEAKQFGVKYIIAPMVETPYALSKYIHAKNRVFSIPDHSDTNFLFNLETITAWHHFPELLKLAVAPDACHGVVFGRVDFSRSLGITRAAIESDKITMIAEEAALLCKDSALDFVMGGAVSIDALPNLNRINSIYLSRFETRKIVFTSTALLNSELSNALRDAVHFELLWLMNKRDYYGFIHHEDETRIAMLEARWNILGDFN